MTERKFTDEEVIRALECCTTSEDCEECPYYAHPTCTLAKGKDALDLINRQRAEIEKLKDIIKQYEQACEESRKEHAHQMELLSKIKSMIMGGQCTSSVGGEGEESD